MKMINQIINKINNKLCILGQQRKIFQETQIGDLLWCKMPLPKKQLKQIEESHRIRPYLVVEKGPNFLLCYQSTTKNRKEMNNYQKYLINGKKYRKKKNSWLDLTKVEKISIKNIQSPYIKLNQIDIKKIEKRIWISQCRGNSDLIRFNEPIYIEIGDVVVKAEKTFYIYSEDNVNIYGFEIQKRNKNKQEFETIKINKKTYYTNFKEFKTINRNDIFDVVNMANEDEIVEIFNKKSAKRLKNNEKPNKTLSKNRNEFEIGTTFQYGNSTVMYLYSDNEKYYGVDLLWYRIKPRVFEIKEIEKRSLVGMKSLEEINKILEFFVEKNMQYSKIKRVYQQIRNLLYSSVA
mgnify:FL=1